MTIAGRRATRALAVLVPIVLIPAVAAAHPGHEADAAAHPFVAGFSHPFGGLDHMLAMVTVGLWAAQAGGRALWAWPAAFLATMVAAGAAGMAGFALPLVEPGILASIVVLGLMVAAGVRAPLAVGAALVGVFALFHGNAHGLEAPAGGAAAYAAGFVLATAILHGLGIGAAMLAGRVAAPVLVRAGGAVGAVAGLALALG